MMKGKPWDDCCGVDRGVMATNLAKGSVAAAMKNPRGVENTDKNGNDRNPLRRRFLTKP